MMRTPWSRKKTVTSAQNTQAAPAKQEKPVANATTETVAAVINVIGLTGDERWVFPYSPRYPMPRKETVKLEAMPDKNCAIPAGWYYPDEFGSTEELVIKFPDESRELLCLLYAGPAIYIQYITFKYERDTGTVFATAWGNDHERNCCWQTTVKFDVVQTFSPYVAVVDGRVCMDTRLCESGFVGKILHGSPLRVRAAYSQSYETAMDTFSLLIDNTACIIAAAARHEFERTFKIQAEKMYSSVTSSVEDLKKLIEDVKNHVAHAAVKKFYGHVTSEAEFRAAQILFDRFVKLTNELDTAGDAYYHLCSVRKMCGVSLDLSRFEAVFDYVGTCILEINGLFEILRG